jgi:excisionase family DNA binding protein
MKMETITFDNLPEAVAMLIEKVQKIEQLLTSRCLEQPENQQLMGVKEAAAFLELSVATVYTKVCRGEIPAYKPGRKLYFDKAMLVANIKSRKKKPHMEITESQPTVAIGLPKQQKRKAFRW